MKKLWRYLSILLALMLCSLQPAFAGGSIAIGVGHEISATDTDGSPYMIEGRYEDNGFYGALSYQTNQDWSATPAKSDDVDIIGLSGGIASTLGPLLVHAGGGYNYVDYGNDTDWQPSAQFGAEYVISRYAIGTEVKRMWLERAGVVDTVMATFRVNF